MIRSQYLFLLVSLFYCVACTPTASITEVSRPTFKNKYAKYFEEGANVIEEGYTYTFERTKDGRYIQKDFYPSTLQMTAYKTYSDRAATILNGKYIDWCDNGNKWKEGTYENGQQTGSWKYYQHRTGALNRFGEYEAGEKTGVWTTLDSLGNKKLTATYKNGRLDGITQSWNNIGAVVKEIVYKEGEKISEKILDESAEVEKFQVVETLPSFAGCEAISDEKERKQCADRKMLRFIYTNIKYPAFARENGIQGMAIMNFVIDETGAVTKVTTLRGICDEIKAECLRIIDMMPNWNPGLQDGKPVKVEFTLPIKFKLE